MFDDDLFSHLEPSETKEYVLHDDLRIPQTSDKPLTLIVVHAGRHSAYAKAIAKHPSLPDEEARIERTVRDIATHVIVDWKHCEVNGESVKYSPDHGAQVLTKLLAKKRDEIVESLILYTRNPDNFRKPIVKAADLKKA